MLQSSRCAISQVFTVLFSVFLLTCCIISSAYGQVNNELDEPFILRNGEPYRDKLTIASSKAVTNFAKLYQHRQDFRAKHDKRQSKASTKADRGSKPAFTTFGVGYDEQSHAAEFDRRFPGIEFRDSRSLKVLPKVKRERVRADREERRLLRPTPRPRFPDIRPAPKRRHRRPKPGLFRSRTPRPKAPVRKPPITPFDIKRVKPLRRQNVANALERSRPVNPFKARQIRPKSSVRRASPTRLSTIQQEPLHNPSFVSNAVTPTDHAIPFQPRTLRPKPLIRQPPPTAFSTIQHEPVRKPIPISNTIIRPRKTRPVKPRTLRPRPPIRQSPPTQRNAIHPEPPFRPVIVSNEILQQPALPFSNNYYETGQSFVQPYRNSPIALPAISFASHSGIDLSISPSLFPVNYGFAVRHY